MLEDLFQQQRKSIEYFFDHIDYEQARQIFLQFLHCEGMIVFSGMGKSGIIAEKLAMTMISTGTKALYLPAANALHGDLGIVSEKDLLVLISKSGESKELIELATYAQKKQTKVLAFVSNKGCTLEKLVDQTMFLPLDRELCPFDLAPTTSTAVQLIFGDVLAVELMKAKSFTLSDYAKNHPAGSIGKKVTLTVRDLMLQGKELPLCYEQDLLKEVLFELSSKRCGCLLVVNQNKQLLGIFTDGDLRRALEKYGNHALEKPVKQLMTSTYLSTTPSQMAYLALKQMQENQKKWVTTIPVLEKNHLVGLIRMHDIIREGIH